VASLLISLPVTAVRFDCVCMMSCAMASGDAAHCLAYCYSWDTHQTKKVGDLAEPQVLRSILQGMQHVASQRCLEGVCTFVAVSGWSCCTCLASACSRAVIGLMLFTGSACMLCGFALESVAAAASAYFLCFFTWRVGYIACLPES
jgi:hypothetical protein